MKILMSSKSYKLVNGSLLFLGAIFLSGSLPYVPVADDIWVYPFLFTFIGSLLMGLFIIIYRPKLDVLSLLIIMFLLYLSMNYFVAAIHEVPLSDWFRGIVPFFFLLGYPLANKFFPHNQDKLYRAIWLATLFWLVRLLFLTGMALFDIISGSLGRLTHIATETLIPFGMVGFILTLYHEKLPKLIKLGLSGIFILVVIMAGYRSQIILCLLVLLLWARINRPIRAMLLIPFIFYLVISVQTLDHAVINLTTTRFTNLLEETEGTRKKELVYTISNFSDSPFLGKGLSYPIPVQLTRDKRMLASFDTNYVRYTHNIIGYFLMDTGLIGVIILGVIWFYVFYKILQLFKKLKNNPQLTGIVLSWLTLSAFFLISASFRQIQTVFLFSIMMHIITKYETR